MSEFFKKIIKDIRIELDDEFDRNFERKAFFDKKWTKGRLSNRKGSIMSRSGALRGSIRSRISGDTISYQSSVPYAKIHNEGGEITVTAKMKSFFWAMYYKASNASGGSKIRQERMSDEAKQWRNLGLMKVGQKMKIEQRQFIGDHSSVKQLARDMVNDNLKEINEYYKSKIKSDS